MAFAQVASVPISHLSYFAYGSFAALLLCLFHQHVFRPRSELNKATSCRGLPQAQVLEILNDVVSALGYLHNRRIIHRDLKPENVVMKAEEARLVYKLIDLGYAKELGVSSLARSFVGTLQYVAPELFLEHDYTRSVDYWSLGLLCHEIVTGQFGLELQQMFAKISLSQTMSTRTFTFL